MFNIKTKFDIFQILGKDEFSRRTNTRSWEGCEHAKLLTKSISSDSYQKYLREILGQKTEKMQLLSLILFCHVRS